MIDLLLAVVAGIATALMVFSTIGIVETLTPIMTFHAIVFSIVFLRLLRFWHRVFKR